MSKVTSGHMLTSAERGLLQQQASGGGRHRAAMPRRAPLVSSVSADDFNVRVRLDASGVPMSAMGGGGAWGGGEEGGMEEEEEEEAAAGGARGGEDLYADDINFHHCKQFRISAIVHEKRGVVGFSKTR